MKLAETHWLYRLKTIFQKHQSPKGRWLLTAGVFLSLLLPVSVLAIGMGEGNHPNQLPQEAFSQRWTTLNVGRYDFRTLRDFKTAKTQLINDALHLKNQSSPVPTLLLADLLNTMGHNKAAIFFYRKALELIESDWFPHQGMTALSAQVHEKLALLYYEQGDTLASIAEIKHLPDIEQSANNPDLVSALQNCLEFPERADFHLALARELKFIYKLSQAQDELEKAIRSNPGSHLKFQIRAFQKVEMPLKPVKLSPLARYYMMAGDSRAFIDNFEGARAYYQQVIHEAPDFEWGYNALANMLRKQQKYKQASQAAEKAIALNPDFYHAYFTHGDILLDQDHFKGAIVSFQAGLALLEQSPTEEGAVHRANVENQLGFAFEGLHQYPQASQHYHRALVIAQENESEDEMDYYYAQQGLSRLARVSKL
jgi:tetratricopeptide (TPR) repeat protein